MARDFNQDYTDEKMSKINSAGIINITIENLWRESYSMMLRGDLVRWNRKLDAIWLILGGDVHEKSPDEQKFDELEMKIFETGSLSHKKDGFETMNEDENEKMALQYLLLKQKALFLRRLQNRQGKGTAYGSDDEDDFD